MFTRSYSGPLNDNEGFIELIPGSSKSEKPINIIGTNKVHLKFNCKDGTFLDGVRQPTLYSFTLDQPPEHKIYRKLRPKTFLNDE